MTKQHKRQSDRQEEEEKRRRQEEGTTEMRTLSSSLAARMVDAAHGAISIAKESREGPVNAKAALTLHFGTQTGSGIFGSELETIEWTFISLVLFLGFGILAALLVCLFCKFRRHRALSLNGPLRETSFTSASNSHSSINSMLAPY